MAAPLESTGLLAGNNGIPRYNQPTGPTFTRAVYPIFNNPFSPSAIAAADRRARRRFALTLVLGFLLWLLLGLFVGVIGGEGAWWGGDRPYDSRWPGALEPIPDADGDISYCADFLKTLPTSVIVVPPPDKGHFVIPHSLNVVDDEVEVDSVDTLSGGDWDSGDGHQRTIYKSKVYFHLPISSAEGLFTLARGQYSTGPIKYILEEPQASKDSPSDEDYVDGSAAPSSQRIEVEVVARWNDKELLKSSKVCALTKHANSTSHHTERGVGIYTPSNELPGPYRHLSFETVVRLPPSGLAYLKSISLLGPMFAPVDINLSPIEFGHASFNTSNGSIHAQTTFISASTDIKTSNGVIEGNFSVSERLSLQNSNGKIDAHVHLVKKDEKQAKIDIEAHTTNGNVYVNYKEHPVGVVLESSAKTTNGDAMVTHQPAFEGTFELSTSWGKGTIQSSRKTSDPTGAKRKRHFEITDDKSNFGIVEKKGDIYWGDDGKSLPENAKGKSVVQTTLGTAHLDFL